jgi:DNA-binding NarL/FixJ family response regulator
MIRIVIAEDHHLVREGIRALLEKAGGIDIVGEAVDGQEAVELTRRLTPDVLLMDIAMPRLNGIQAAEQLRDAGVPTNIVILSMYSDEILVRQALQNGVKGFLPKGAVSEELLFAVRAARRGALYLSPSIPSAVLADHTSQNDPKAKGASGRLTAREREMLQLIGKGHTNNQMAQAMGVSVKTVERHRTNLMQKLNAHNLVELIRIALTQGLLPLDDDTPNS